MAVVPAIEFSLLQVCKLGSGKLVISDVDLRDLPLRFLELTPDARVVSRALTTQLSHLSDRCSGNLFWDADVIPAVLFSTLHVSIASGWAQMKQRIVTQLTGGVVDLTGDDDSGHRAPKTQGNLQIILRLLIYVYTQHNTRAPTTVRI